MAWTKAKTVVSGAALLFLGTGGSIVAYKATHSAHTTASGPPTGDSFFKGGGEIRLSIHAFNDLPPEVRSHLEAHLKEPRALEEAVRPALKKYAAANKDGLPRDFQDLKPYMTEEQFNIPNLDDWQIVATGRLSTLEPYQILLQKKQFGPGGKPAALITASGGVQIDIPSVNGRGSYQISEDERPRASAPTNRK